MEPSQSNNPPGNCTASTTLIVEVYATPAPPTMTGTPVQLNGFAYVRTILANCEYANAAVPFTWKLTFQAPNGGETDVTNTLTDAKTLTPSFTPPTDGTYLAQLTGTSPKLGSKSAVTSVPVVPPPPVLLESEGHITFLRVHDLGTGFGPAGDFIDVEAVVQIDSEPGKSFGFQLRNDKFRPSREGQLNLLRDAFNHNSTVLLDYLIIPGKTNGILFRTALTKQ